ncbi:hypothetical protein HK107_11005 [Parvularcula sp. ZS-1/3]|uniref:Sulphotransferase Stf0 domain-containing protein n=1 Tax=Parvularcula mediterranea TaxID=2732508 RepID=A0A7Y3RMJ1_9PROT|nr:hypothetical protein [Parvularcula mediterranea]NNU16846.1 hypothetical protein [Parvularcula mediterranea]
MIEADLRESAAAEPRTGNAPMGRFCLLCHQRSGSNALGAILNADPRVFLYGQLFNDFFPYWRRRRGTIPKPYRPHPEVMKHFGTKPALSKRIERLASSLVPHEDDLDAFMARTWDRFEEKSPDTPTRGFKLHDFQLTDDELTSLAKEHVEGTVILWRKNLFKAAVSWAYAMKTDVWSSPRKAKLERPTFDLDIGQVEWFIEKTRSEVEGWRRVLTASGAPFIELNYEENVATRELETLYDFLGIAWQGKPEFKTEKLAANSYAHVSNARAIEKALASPENGSLFE